VREELLEGDAEKSFWDTLRRIEPVWAELASRADYPQMLLRLK
jgi:hypothetical protein